MAGSSHQRATRGHGLLESFLARKRRELAHTLLRPLGPIERVLDIGCGAFPHMLKSVDAMERVGIDRMVDADLRSECARDGIQLVEHDIARASSLAFESDRFDAVTMLAVIEHVPIDDAASIVREIYRVLRPGGVFVLTTPASWTGRILRTMARLSLVSPEEIDEHKSLFSCAELERLLGDGGFRSGLIENGTFEIGMNLWARATK
jgi:SAM-dependent methyltransferase